MVFHVKSGAVGRGEISKLNNDRQREGAELAVFITLQDATKGMRDEASSAGFYSLPHMGRNSPRILIVTIEEMLKQSVRLDMPLSVDVLKSARTLTEKSPNTSMSLEDEE